jgi:hypothetical protein
MSGWNRNGFFTAGMKRFVLNVSEHTDGCFTAAFFQTQLLHFLCRVVPVATQRLAMSMEQERTYLLVRMSSRTAWPPVFNCRSKQLHTSWI